MRNISFRRYAVRGLAAALCAALGVSVAGGLKRYIVHRRENLRLARKVAAAEADVGRKRSLLGLAQTNDDLLEGEARRQLGLIGEGEIEFRFVTDEKSGGERMDVSDGSSPS